MINITGERWNIINKIKSYLPQSIRVKSQESSIVQQKERSFMKSIAIKGR